MKSLLKEIHYNDIDFAEYSSQQFATVIFDRNEDSETAQITVLRSGKINQFDGDNRFNPSARRHSSCVYVREEWDDGKVIKICTIQHKGNTLVEIHRVTDEELLYLFKTSNLNELLYT
ncbi:short-chain dehydrogenase [Enterovibrio norvegicus]|uniref:Short-chain dehydrogenase n=1 Tax=Enterovibrio norvegicus TaxID=188144 RepID=A0ABV4L547_9GAMM